MLAVVPEAYGAGTSKISGKVMEKLSNAVPEVNVTVLNASREFVAGGVTQASGEYTVPGLVPGTYRVRFSPPFESALAPQYYNGALSFSEATAVTIGKEGEEKSGIDATLHEGGKISGKVEGPKGEPLQEIGIAVLGAEFNGFALTNAAGEYMVMGLPKNLYKVEFIAVSPESNLVPQFYNGAASFSTATPVEVKEEETKPNINAKLQEGGEISGTVTDAATHAPLGEVCVSANNSLGFEFFGGFAETAANGKYTIHGLEKGSYNVEFEYCPLVPGVKYITQFVNGVEVTAGHASEISVALERSAPVNTAPPVLSGTAAVGQTLSCLNGSWTGLAPLEFTYAWLRDGGAIDGASGATYVVQPADQGHGVACQVTATNSVAHEAATSNTVKVPPPASTAETKPPPPPLPPSSPPPPPPLPLLPPTVEQVTQSHSSWSEGSKLATYSRRKMAPVGTTISFVLNEQATVSVVFTQQVSGRVTGGKCVAQTNKNRRRAACKRAVTQGTLSFSGHSGLNKLVFQGPISASKRLPLGAYTLRITASNSAGQRSSARTLNFTIVK